jgi:hypothetical protein
LKKRSNKTNSGICFVSFRDKSCVSTTIDEIDILKTKISGIEMYERVDLMNWEIDEAVPQSDIIWAELNLNKKSASFFFRLLLSKLLPFIVSTVLVLIIMKLDTSDLRNWFPVSENSQQIPVESILIKYISPLLLGYLAFYILPKIIFNVALPSMNIERHSKK